MSTKVFSRLPQHDLEDIEGLIEMQVQEIVSVTGYLAPRMEAPLSSTIGSKGVLGKGAGVRIIFKQVLNVEFLSRILDRDFMPAWRFGGD